MAKSGPVTGVTEFEIEGEGPIFCLVSWVFIALVINDDRSDIEGVWLGDLNELSF